MTDAPVANLDAREWKELSFGTRFAGRYADLARPLGAKKLGFNVQEILPGKAQLPYHFHTVNEELLWVLAGTPRVRLNGAEYELCPGDMVALPPGAASAHHLLNYGDDPARAFLASTMIPYDYIEYPDSGKRMFAMGSLAHDPPFARVMARGERARDLQPMGDFDTCFEGEPCEVPLGDPPPAATRRDERIVHRDDVTWEPYGTGPFRGERKRIGRQAGARLLGYSIYRLVPDGRSWPYHFHHANEEMFAVLAGRARLRTPTGEREVGPGDVILCPPGADGAHGFQAVGSEPFEVFALSTMIEPEVVEYPDSDKVYVMVGQAPGGEASARAVDLVVRKADAVSYLEGEA